MVFRLPQKTHKPHFPIVIFCNFILELCARTFLLDPYPAPWRGHSQREPSHPYPRVQIERKPETTQDEKDKKATSPEKKLHDKYFTQQAKAGHHLSLEVVCRVHLASPSSRAGAFQTAFARGTCFGGVHGKGIKDTRHLRQQAGLCGAGGAGGLPDFRASVNSTSLPISFHLIRSPSFWEGV